MQRPALLLALGLVVIAFAGCLESAPVEEPGNEAPPATGEWTTPTLPGIDSAAFLEAHAEFVSTYHYRANNAPTHVGARDFLEQEFLEAGLPVWRQEFEKGIHQENICGVKLGSVEPTWWVVTGGHYDTTTTDDAATSGQGDSAVSQGAYDDGSGTWITVEAAKAFATVDTYYSVLFCAFDGEERGLQGSQAVFEGMHDSDVFPFPIDGVRGMVDFDMFGICWPVRAPIYFDTNDKVLGAEVQKIRKEMGIPDDMFKQQGITLGQSDYAHWYNAKDAHYPTAFFISDFEELGAPLPTNPGVPVPGVPGAYPWWHNTDTVETMTLMAGGQEMLEAGFQTALDLGMATLSVMALEPDVEFEPSESP